MALLDWPPTWSNTDPLLNAVTCGNNMYLARQRCTCNKRIETPYTINWTHDLRELDRLPILVLELFTEWLCTSSATVPAGYSSDFRIRCATLLPRLFNRQVSAPRLRNVAIDLSKASDTHGQPKITRMLHKTPLYQCWLQNCKTVVNGAKSDQSTSMHMHVPQHCVWDQYFYNVVTPICQVSKLSKGKVRS